MNEAALDLATTSKTMPKTRESIFADQLVVYICILAVVALASYGYWVHTRSIFACQGKGYTEDRYLASCNGANYADYEHGAFWFDLEPAALAAAKNADVLFLGNSRLQAALSTPQTADWFSAASARYYLMGFSYNENMAFEEGLLDRIRPRARVYVINLDDFFSRSESAPTGAVLHDRASRGNYESKQFWQRVHAPICDRFGVLCGSKFAVFRSRETGAYFTQGAIRNQISPVSYDETINQALVDRNVAEATKFLKRFAQGKCVILTLVPFVGTDIGDAKAIAAALGKKLVIPENVEGLQTYDGYHFDQQSARRWSEGFFQTAGPEIQKCLADKNQTQS